MLVSREEMKEYLRVSFEDEDDLNRRDHLYGCGAGGG